MQSDGVVEADDVVSDIVDGLGVVGMAALPDAFHLQVQKNRSITALSQQLALRLMLAIKPCCASRAL